MYSEDDRLVLVFNGEIYNYRSLTAELTAAGAHLRHPLRQRGASCTGGRSGGAGLLPRLRGMFAFALWDRTRRTRWSARGIRSGSNRGYYCQAARTGRFRSGSEIKAFLDHPSFEKRLNAAQLPLYLSCQYSPGGDTFFAGVQKLLPGHFLTFSDGIVRTTRWVQPAFVPGDTPPPLPAEIEAVLRGSVEAHKIADVEVAGFLSGGVDSRLHDRAGYAAAQLTPIGYAEPRATTSPFHAAGVGTQSRHPTTGCGASAPAEFWERRARRAVPHGRTAGRRGRRGAVFFEPRGRAGGQRSVCPARARTSCSAGYNIYTRPLHRSAGTTGCRRGLRGRAGGWRRRCCRQRRG